MSDVTRFQVTRCNHPLSEGRTEPVDSRGRPSGWMYIHTCHCGDIEIVGYLANVAGPVTLVLDLRVAHDRVGSSADPTLNGHLRYPNTLISPLMTQVLISYVNITVTTILIRPGV